MIHKLDTATNGELVQLVYKLAGYIGDTGVCAVCPARVCPTGNPCYEIGHCIPAIIIAARLELKEEACPT